MNIKLMEITDSIVTRRNVQMIGVIDADGIRYNIDKADIHAMLELGSPTNNEPNIKAGQVIELMCNIMIYVEYKRLEAEAAT